MQGTIATMDGGDFGSSFLSGFAGGLMGSAGDALKWGGVGTVSSAMLMGGVSSELSGGEFWRGAAVGGIVAGANHVAHRIGASAEEKVRQKRQRKNGGGERPDGYLTFSEARDWWLNGNGQSLYVDLNKLDLSGIKASDFDKGIGSVKTFNLLGKYRSNTVDGLVYGNIELKLTDENTVQVYRRQSYGLPIDVYNFDIKSWSTGTFFRNIETFGGWIVNGGSGTPYIIWMHGQAKIGQ